MKLYAHPFSSYSQKVLVALYANATPFDYCNLEDPAANAELATLWPLKRFPVLVDSGHTILESSTIIEHLQLHHPGPTRMIPEGDAGIEAHMLDRIFDNHVMTPMQKIVADRLRADGEKDPRGVENAREMLAMAYGLIDGHMAERTWAAGEAFSLADCAATPALFYAGIVAPWGEEQGALGAYFERLVARPSVARTLAEARPFFDYFPYRELMPARFLEEA